MSFADRIRQKKEERQAELIAKSKVGDPRPDLARDSEEWSKLLEIAAAKDQELAGRLHGFRCAGTLLIPHKKFGYAMRPYIDKNGKAGWTCTEEYNAAKNEWLAPYGEQIVSILGELKEMVE